MSKRKYILKIQTDRERLSDRSDEVNIFDKKEQERVSHIVADLKDTLRNNKDLIALSAPQLGYHDRVFCIKFASNEIKAFINPIITKIEGRQLNIETCASLDNKEFMVQRPSRILLGYQTPTGEFKSDVEIKEPVSCVVDQMIDMLDGILFLKYETQGIEISDDYYKASEEDKEALHTWYKEEYLPKKCEELNKLAESDEKIKRINEGIKFMTALANNEIELEKLNKEEN